MKDIIGLNEDEIKLVDYNEKWSQIFEKEKEILINSCGKFFLEIEHFGSTSIKGIKAKPIIDIIIAVEDFNNINIIENNLAKLGYIKKETNIPGDELFTKNKNNQRLFNVHVVKKTSKNWELNITFRNKLRNDFILAKKYEKLKIELLNNHPKDRIKYMYGKTDFVFETADMLDVLKANENILRGPSTSDNS